MRKELEIHGIKTIHIRDEDWYWDSYTQASKAERVHLYPDHGEIFKLRINLNKEDFVKHHEAIKDYLLSTPLNRTVLKGFKHTCIDHPDFATTTDDYHETGQFTLYLEEPVDHNQLHAFTQALSAELTRLGVRASPPMSSDSQLLASHYMSMRLERADRAMFESRIIKEHPALLSAYRYFVEDTRLHQLFCQPHDAGAPPVRDTDDAIHQLIKCSVATAYHEVNTTGSIHPITQTCLDIAKQCRQATKSSRPFNTEALNSPSFQQAIQIPMARDLMRDALLQTCDGKLPRSFKLLAFREEKFSQANRCCFSIFSSRKTIKNNLQIAGKLVDAYVNGDESIQWSDEELKLCRKGELKTLLETCDINLDTAAIKVHYNPAFRAEM